MVGTQQFNLRWNNHTSNILQVFLEHLSSESLVDVTLSCQGRFIRAHKIILSACSPYFQEVFANHTDKHPIIILNGIKYEDLRSMIKFMYNGEIRVQETQLDDLLAAAETLQVKGLSNVRSKYEKGEIMSLNSSNDKSVTPNKSVESAATTTTATTTTSTSTTVKQELPLHTIKAAVALFAPTATTPRASNTRTTHCITPATKTISTVTHRLPASTYRTTPRVAKTTFQAVGVNGKRASSKVVPGVAIATLVPANAIIPIADPTLSSRIPTVVSTATTSSTATITATTMTTTTTIFSSPTTTTTESALISSDSSCALTIDPTSITSGADVHFDEIDDNANVDCKPIADHKPIEIFDVTAVVDKAENPIASRSNDFAHTNENSFTPNVKVEPPEIDTPPTMPTIATMMSTITPTTESSEINTSNKSNITEVPRVRKRRKMSHTVNELAKETVFASNGTVLLEPDEAVLRSIAKMKKMSSVETRTTENSPTSQHNELAEPKQTEKPKMTVLTKQPQTSLLIRDKEQDLGKTPRPPNAFMIFANEWRRKLAAKYQNESNTKISVRLGMMWKGLSIPAKETYYRLAKKANEEHKRRFPSYYYSPKEARMRKNSKQDPMSVKCLPVLSKNTQSQRMVRVYVNGEERQTNYFTDTDSSNYDDYDEDDDNYDSTEYAFGNDTEMVDHPENSDDPEQSSVLITKYNSLSSDGPNSSSTN